MKSIILTVLFAIFSIANAVCQIYNPVKWSFASKRLNHNGAVIFFKANISNGWYIYGLNVPAGGPSSTTIILNPGKDFTLNSAPQGPKAKTKYESVFKLNIPYHIGEVVFQQKIKLNSKKATTVSGKISFMTCNNETCLPQDEQAFLVTIN